MRASLWVVGVALAILGAWFWLSNADPGTGRESEDSGHAMRESEPIPSAPIAVGRQAAPPGAREAESVGAGRVDDDNTGTIRVTVDAEIKRVILLANDRWVHAEAMVESGGCEFGELVPGPYRVRAQANWWQEARVEVKGGESHSVHLKAEEQVVLSYRVVTPAGDGVDGALLWGAMPALGRNEARLLGRSGVDGRAEATLPEFGEIWATHALGISERMKVVAFRAEPGRADGMELVLTHAPTRLDLRVEDSGGSLRPATLRVVAGEPGASSWSVPGGMVLRTETGRASCVVPRGRVRLFAVTRTTTLSSGTESDRRIGQAELEVATERASATVRVAPGRSVIVRVADAAGRPLRAVVVAQAVGFSQFRARGETAGDTGSVALRGLPTGALRVTATADGHRLQTRDCTADHSEVRLVLEPTERARIRVVDPRGRPMSGWWLSCGPSQAQTDAEGWGDVERLAPTVVVRQGFGFGPIVARLDAPPVGDERVFSLDVEDVLTGWVVGRLVDGTGRPVAGARMSGSLGRAFVSGAEWTCDATGFRIGPLCPGDYRISFGHGAQRASLQVTVEKHATIRVGAVTLR